MNRKNTAPDLSAKLRKLVETAHKDSSYVGGTLRAFEPFLTECADMIDDLGEKLSEAIRFWEQNRAEAARLKLENDAFEKSVLQLFRDNEQLRAEIGKLHEKVFGK